MIPFSHAINTSSENSSFIPGKNHRIYIHFFGFSNPQRQSYQRLNFSLISPVFEIIPNRVIKIFRKPLFNFVMPDVQPEISEIIRHVSVQASPGEFEPTTFLIRSTKDILNVTCEVSDMVGTQGEASGKMIPPQENGIKTVDVRLVKIWQQAGRDTDIAAEPVMVPELLVYDDLETLSGDLPEASQVLRTAFAENQSKQFWVTVFVPPATTAGRYEARITILGDGQVIARLPLVLNVLPIQLKEPKQSYILYYDSTVLGSVNDPVRENLIDIQMEDVRRHGFSGVRLSGTLAINHLNDPTQNTLLRNIDKFIAHGFQGPLIYKFWSYTTNLPEKLKFIVDRSNELGITPYFYGQDEPNKLCPGVDSNCADPDDENYPQNSMGHHLYRSQLIHEAGGQVGVAIRKDIADLLDNFESQAYDVQNPYTFVPFRDLLTGPEKLEIANYKGSLFLGPQDPQWYKMEKLWTYIENLRAGKMKKRTDKLEVYYWQMWYEYPLRNRLMSGYFLWTSRLDGVWPYVYEAPSNNPYDDFDSPNGRDMMVVYPSRQGPIPTLKWEEIREGYDDVRYLTTLNELLKKMDNLDKSYADNVRSQIKQELAKYEKPWEYVNLTGDDFQNSRKKIAQLILDVQAKL